MSHPERPVLRVEVTLTVEVVDPEALAAAAGQLADPSQDGRDEELGANPANNLGLLLAPGSLLADVPGVLVTGSSVSVA